MWQWYSMATAARQVDEKDGARLLAMRSLQYTKEELEAKVSATMATVARGQGIAAMATVAPDPHHTGRHGMGMGAACHGTPWHGTAHYGLAWHGTATPWHGMAWYWQHLGTAWHCVTWYGIPHSMAYLATPWHGMRYLAWHCMGVPYPARHGIHIHVCI